jgi:hypothetical protein
LVLSKEGRRKLSELAKTRERTLTGRFLPVGSKYVYDMSYIKAGSSHGIPANQKWTHVRITQYSRNKFAVSDFRKIAVRTKPSRFAIPRGNRDRFEAFEKLAYSRRQARLEGLDDEKPHIEVYTGRGGGLVTLDHYRY